MTKFLLGGAALAALVAVAPATAQPVQAPIAQRAPAVQVHTRAQVAAQVATMFQRLDTNRDGFISRTESQVAKAHRGAHKIQRSANRSPEQRMAKRAAAFDRLDVNRNGVLTRDEFARGQTVRQQRMAAGGQRLRRPGARTGEMRGTMAGLRGHMFDMADVNRDGRVTMPEATAAAYRHFDMADANRDGQVTREERMQVRQHMRAPRQPG